MKQFTVDLRKHPSKYGTSYVDYSNLQLLPDGFPIHGVPKILPFYHRVNSTMN